MWFNQETLMLKATLIATSTVCAGASGSAWWLSADQNAAGAAIVARSAAATIADFPICHGPTAVKATNGAMRLAASRTEVPQAEMQAATSAAAFADIDPPLWEGLGSVAYKITTS